MNRITTESYNNSIRSDSFIISQQNNNETKSISNINQTNPMIIKMKDNSDLRIKKHRSCVNTWRYNKQESQK